MSEQEGQTRFFAKAGEIRCSFCGKDHRSIWKIIASTGAYICDECTALVIDIFSTEESGFRVAVRHPDGSIEKLEVQHGKEFSVVGWCRKCGTLLAGYGVTQCLNCGAPLGQPPEETK